MTNRVALVTGGIGGIGTAICKRLSDSGYQVVAADLRAEDEPGKAWQRECASEGYEFGLVAMNVTDFEHCREAVTRVEETTGPIGVLVNCAGITRDGVLKKMDFEQWDAVIRTNLDSVFNVTRHVIDRMLNKQVSERPQSAKEVLDELADRPLVLVPVEESDEVELDDEFGTSRSRILGDIALVEQAIGNLVENAFKYSKPDSTIYIRCSLTFSIAADPEAS